MKKLLVIRFSSIGDIILTTPIVRCLKKYFPECEIHYLTKQAFKPILKANPYITKIITIDKRINEALPILRAEKYDFVVDLHKNFRSIGVRLALGGKSSSFPKLNFKKWLLVNFKINLLPNIHIVDRYFEAIESMGVKNDNSGLDYFIPEMEPSAFDLIPESHRSGYVAMVIGGKHKTKQMPVELSVRLVKEISYPVIILGGPDDSTEGSIIESEAGNQVWSACGKLSINQSAMLIKQAKVVITNDTGLMHIAAAFKKQIISIWGNTIQEFGMYPYIPSNKDLYRIFEVNGLDCRPCSKIGFDKCPKKHFNCMMKQDINAIAMCTSKMWEN